MSSSMSPSFMSSSLVTAISVPTVVVVPPDTDQEDEEDELDNLSYQGGSSGSWSQRLRKSHTLDLELLCAQDGRYLTVPPPPGVATSTMQSFGFSVSMGSLLAWHDLYEIYDDEDTRHNNKLLCTDKLPQWYGAAPIPHPDWYSHLPVVSHQSFS